MGASQTEMTRAIFGAAPRDGGEILLDGEPVKIEKPLDAIEAGIVLAPEDRKKDGRELGIDSLDTVELLMELEDKIGMEIELDQEVKTVGDLVNFIEF